MVVVAEAPSDVPFAPQPSTTASARANCAPWNHTTSTTTSTTIMDINNNPLLEQTTNPLSEQKSHPISEQTPSTKGPVNSSSCMSASYMNTNGSMGSSGRCMEQRIFDPFDTFYCTLVTIIRNTHSYNITITLKVKSYLHPNKLILTHSPPRQA